MSDLRVRFNLLLEQLIEHLVRNFVQRALRFDWFDAGNAAIAGRMRRKRIVF